MKELELTLEITKACNLKCPHCIKGDSNLMPYPAEDCFNAEKALEFYRKHNVRRVLISGGEPLTKKDLLKRLIIGIGRDKVLLATNGLLLDEDMVGFFNENKVSVMVSAIRARDCDAALIKKIVRRWIKFVIQPKQAFAPEAVELARMFDCRVELTFDVSKVKDIDDEALDVFEANLKASRPYVKIATKISECNRCHLNLEWRCDNKIISYRQVYGVTSKIPEGCAYYYQSLGPERFSRFLALAKEYSRPCVMNARDMWDLNKCIVEGVGSPAPLVFGQDGLFVWQKLQEAYHA